MERASETPRTSARSHFGASRLPRRPRSIVALSIPVYVGLAWLIWTALPNLGFLAVVPAVFAVHSAAVLLFRKGL